MRKRLSRLAAALIAVLAFSLAAGPSLAHASGWPLANTEASTLRAFGSTYRLADGDARTHTGVDLEASRGDEVRSPSDGTVTFAGSVPAVGAARTTLACTVELHDGSQLTFMPLETLQVKRGQKVSEGGALGGIAAEGDASSPSSHLHVSLRVNGLYVDPFGVLARPSASPAPVSPGGPAVVVSSPSAVRSVATRAAGGPALVIGSVPSPVAAGAPVRVMPRIPQHASVRATAPGPRPLPVTAAARPHVKATRAPALTPPCAAGASASAWLARSVSSAAGQGSWLPVAVAVAGVAFGAGLLVVSRRVTVRAAALLSDVRPVREDVAAAADRW